MELTREHIQRAAFAGACREALDTLTPGVDILTLPSGMLDWASGSGIIRPDEEALLSPLGLPIDWIYGSGYGYGYGSGYGYGDGYGDGSGDGSGSGDG